MRFSAGHQQRRFPRDGHRSMLPLIFDPTWRPHKPCPATQIYFEMSSFQITETSNANANAPPNLDALANFVRDGIAELQGSEMREG